MTYVLYKVGQAAGAKENYSRVMTSDSAERLRNDANAFFSNPDNFVGRHNEQWIIPTNEMQSNVVTTKAGESEYHRYLLIREVKGSE